MPDGPDRVSATAACPDVAELMLASENELPKQRLLAIRAHVRGCASCRKHLGDTQLAIDSFGEDLSGAPPSPADIDASSVRHDTFHRRLRVEQREFVQPEVAASARSLPSGRA